MAKAFGGDLSLNHGSVVMVELEDDFVVEVKQVYGWDKKDSHKLSLKSTHEEIYNKVRSICQVGMAGYTLAIDWAFMSVYWQTKKLFVVQMGLFLGMLYSHALESFIQPNFVSPKELREFWKLKGNAPKEELQTTVLNLFPPPQLFEREASEDDIDAYILALYVLLKGKETHDK